MSNLVEKKCKWPCDPTIPPYDAPAANALLEQEIPSWGLNADGKKLVKHFEVADFSAARALANKVAEISEIEGHFPDITFGWSYVDLSIYTHVVGGLCENDFILATKIDRATG
jgi:4a-hydroxytetrahydrobiopterin dehydratase